MRLSRRVACLRVRNRTSIEAAFDVAVLPDENGNVREQKPAWLRFLRECEARGVMLPKGAFAVSKMMDSIISQQVTYGLPSVLGTYRGCISQYVSLGYFACRICP